MAHHGDEKQPDPANETAPDPDEDDLDDLDEMLEEFSSTKIDPTPSVPSAPGHSGPGRPAATTAGPDRPPDTSTLDEDEFAKQLQSGMADMLREFESNPQMAKEFEEMMAQFGAAAPPPPSQAQQQDIAYTAPTAPDSDPFPPSTIADATSTSTKTSDDAFQETIRRTMDRMKASSSSADAAASGPSGGEDDIMAALMRELQNTNGGTDGEGDDTFSKMLLGMMEQLTNKEILYEPMKELDTKFPGWLEQNKEKLTKEDESRYNTQKSLVREIVDRFDRAGYSDGNATDREFIVERMQRMQAAGAPPPDLVGDVNAASDMLNDADSGCPQQ